MRTLEYMNSIFAYSLGLNLSESLKIGYYNFSVTFSYLGLIEEKAIFMEETGKHYYKIDYVF